MRYKNSLMALVVASLWAVAAMLVVPVAHAQEQMSNGDACVQAMGYNACSGQRPPAASGGTVVTRGVDPCFIQQNAMRPCTAVRPQAFRPVGVDRTLVGAWELMVPTASGVSRWVWEIHPNGTYAFHAEGPGAVPGHSGTFAAARGHYTLNSTTVAWSDVGTYRVAANGTMLATGRLGSATWRRVH